MQVKPSTSTPTLHLKEQELNPEQPLNELCQRILSGLGEGKVLCVKKVGEREALVLRNLSVWERIFHRCFHWKKQKLRQGTISHFLENVWDNHRSEIRLRDTPAIELVMRRFSLPSYPNPKKEGIDLSSVHQNLTSLKSDSGKPDITLVTSSGQRYTVPRSRLEIIPMFKDLLEASVNVEKEDILLPENCSDESLKLLFDLLERKLLDPISLQAFDELFLLADFLGFDDLQKALSASLADQFKNADMQQKINLAPLLAQWQGLGNFIAQETVDKILYDCNRIGNYSIHKPWLQAILDSLKSMLNEDLPAYTPGLHSLELLRFCGACGMEVDKQLLVPDSDLSRCSSYYQAICHEWGIGTQKDMELAFKQYQLAAKQKDPRAQRALGVCFEDGLGTSKNPDLACYWYRLAAEQGDAVAQIYLGNCYYRGIGTPKDTKEALKWYQRAADQGHAEAQKALGICFELGLETSKNPGLAFYWYRLAAEQKDPRAQIHLGNCYYKGTGTPVDLTLAVEWYRRAADQGFELAKWRIRDTF